MRVLCAVVVLASAGRAAALDCTKAGTAVEKAVCGSPDLMDQDAALSKAYGDRLAQDPARAPALRTEQRAWLAQRERLCGAAASSPARLAACLTGLTRTRLRALAAGSVPVPGPPPLPPAAVLGGPPRPVPPDLPAHGPEPEAILAASAVPASGRSDPLLDVRVPGRFSIQARSAGGVALQLVDMIAGPGDQKGEPGRKDGRIDALLDRGTYKLRVTGAPGAAGDAQLAVRPFRDLEAIANTLIFGGAADATLSDLGQRSFWVAVPKSGHVFVEAAGRALADLRLWRNGTDLSGLAPVLQRVTPHPGRPMTRARIEGDLEPGLYLATAYGGPKLAWADGDQAEPLFVRTGPPEPLLGGWVEGVVGATGSARFKADAQGSSFRLELPEPADATLSVRRGTDPPAVGEIRRNSREPLARVDSPAGSERLVEVVGPEGQPFRLRALNSSASRQISGAGPTWVAVDVAGEGGDDIPATVVLAQFKNDRGGRVLASSAPQIGPGRAWRQKLNLRGRSTLLFEVTAPVEVGVTTAGVKVLPTIAPLLGNAPPKIDDKAPRWTLEAGWYVLTLAPVNDAAGTLDVTLGPVGVTGVPQPSAPRPSIPLGLVQLDRNGDYRLLSNDTPTLVVAPTARPLPVDLEAGPLGLVQAPGQTLDIPVRMPPHGYLAAAGVNGVPVAVQETGQASAPTGRSTTLHIPAPDRARGLVLSWSDPLPADAGAARLPASSEAEQVTAGRARFFDLDRGGTRSFGLDVPDGGLYRVETLGRLHTAITMKTAFLPRLDEADANGAGQNALAQTYLRAGRYAVAVKAIDSAGRAGLAARPAALPEAGLLVEGASARASLADGRGAVFPIAIAEAGRYRLEIFALGKPLRARLEDESGWPLTVPGPTTAIERLFEPGRYRLVVLPEPVDARAVVRLDRVRPVADLVGHGPHPLDVDHPVAFRWREPASTVEARDPDRWTFTLRGPADITLDLSGGMAGELRRIGDDTPVGRIVAKAGFSGRLPPGRYVMEARSQGRNDRLDYRVSLASREIQPGTPRHVELPASIPFAIAEARVVSLTTFGRTDVRGLLKDADGRVVERLGSRADDWNIALSRHLEAGAYTLDLSAADPRPPKKTGEATATQAGDDPDQADGKDGDDASASPDNADAPAAAAGPDDRTASPADDADADAPDDPDSPAAAENGARRPAAAGEGADAGEDKAAASEPPEPDATEAGAQDTGVEVRLALPEPADHPRLTAGAEADADGDAVHRFPLPAVSEGRLMVLAARSGQDLVLSLERADADGRWQVVGFERGKAPVVAAPSDGEAARPWRASLWAVDGGPARMGLAFQAVPPPAASDTEAFRDAGFGAFAPDVRVARRPAPSSGLLMLRMRPDGLSEGSVAGQALQPVTDRILVPQADAVWLVARDPFPATLALDPVSVAGEDLALTVPAGGRATLPDAAGPPGALRLWRAQSTFGQPGLSAGHGFGVASGSAAALGGGEALKVWNAAGRDALSLHLGATDLVVRPGARTEQDYAGALPKGTAQPLALPPGRKRLTLDLAAGTGAVLGPAGAGTTTVWSGDRGVSRTLDGDWADVLLLNPSPEDAPVRVSLAPLAGEVEVLKPGAVAKRFHGAAGSLSMRVLADPGDRLVVAGAAATFVGDDGRVARGNGLSVAGGGELVLDHPPGLVAAWIERAGLSPWPELSPQAVSLPSVLPLAGQAMALALHPAAAVLLHARTSAPVILSLSGAGGRGDPVIFPAGAEFHRLLAAGEATLRLYAPHEGPLAGSLDLTASPVTPLAEGLGEATALAPGASVLFGFEVRRRSPVGVGVRADPDIAAVRLLDETGRPLGSGVAQLRTLDPGRYVLEASVPADGRTTVVRPAVVGLSPAPTGPPPDIARDYLALVGLAPVPPPR